MEEMAGGEDQSAASGLCTCRLALSSLGAVRNSRSREDALLTMRDEAIL